MSETAIAFACAGRAVTETAVAFAGENWAFLERFSVALVLLVSTVAIQGRAVVMGVSCWPASVVAEVSLVASSPRHSCLCAKKFALLGLMVGVSAKKFAQRTKNGRKSVVCSVLGEVFRGNAGGRAVLGEFFRANRCCAQVLDAARRISGWLWWGICSIRSWLAGYLRRVAALMMQFPPFGGDELAVCGGVVAKLQTHWVKRLQKRLVLLNGSAIWRNRSLSWCVVRASPPRTCASISCCTQPSM